MRINDGFLSGGRIDRPQNVDPAAEPTRAARNASIESLDASEISSAHEFAQLVAAVNQTEEVRPGVVENVSHRLAAGVYSTDAAAAQTADALLQASN